MQLGMTDCPSLLRAENRVLPKLTKEAEGAWGGAFCFVQAADTQYGLIERYEKETLPQPWGWEEERRRSELVVAKVNVMDPAPKFLIICGDLVDAYPGWKDKPAQLQTFFEVFAKLKPDIPLICICGNHDVGDQPTPATVREFTSTFGDDYFSFWAGGCRFLVLNSQFFVDASQVADLSSAQEAWLEEQLSTKVTAKHTFVFQHVPWFISDPDEPPQYFNIEPKLRFRWLDRFEKAGVTAILCGHYHRNAGGKFRGIEQVVTSAVGMQLGTDGAGVRVVRVEEKAMKHRYFTLSDIPKAFDPM